MESPNKKDPPKVEMRGIEPLINPLFIRTLCQNGCRMVACNQDTII